MPLATRLGYCVYLLTSGSQLKGNARLEHAILVEGEEKELVETLASISTDQSKAHAKPSVRGGVGQGFGLTGSSASHFLAARNILFFYRVGKE